MITSGWFESENDEQIENARTEVGFFFARICENNKTRARSLSLSNCEKSQFWGAELLWWSQSYKTYVIVHIILHWEASAFATQISIFSPHQTVKPMVENYFFTLWYFKYYRIATGFYFAHLNSGIKFSSLRTMCFASPEIGSGR